MGAVVLSHGSANVQDFDAEIRDILIADRFWDRWERNTFSNRWRGPCNKTHISIMPLSVDNHFRSPVMMSHGLVTYMTQ